MRNLSTCVVILGLGFIILGASGCGENLGNTVNGTVKNKKGDLINGTIVFVDKNGKETPAAILNGEYKANKITAGANDILIKGPPGGVAPGIGAATGAVTKEEITGVTAAKQGVPPNPKYEKKGLLTMEVAAGKNEKNFELDD